MAEDPAMEARGARGGDASERGKPSVIIHDTPEQKEMNLYLYIIAIAMGCYLALAIGVNLIATLAPVPRKPFFNAALLGVVVFSFVLGIAVRLI